jgi:hypothetical protein
MNARERSIGGLRKMSLRDFPNSVLIPTISLSKMALSTLAQVGRQPSISRLL